jgi:uncharacterized protein YegJ (DUF2314 family)
MTVEPQNIKVACRECLEKNKGVFDIEIGDYVKIRFGEDDSQGEYMWIKVTNVSGDRCEGTLDNDPVIVENIKCGDIIIFWHGDVCERIRDWERA